MSRVVLITGGMSGIGLATAEAFAQAGDKVCVVDRQQTAEGRSIVESTGGRTFDADVRDFAAAERIVSELIAAEERLNVLVNNAGIARDHVLWKMSEAEWDDVLGVNLKGAFNYSRAAAPVMRRQERGWIVSVSSINALRGKAGLCNYAASKAGLIALTRTMARELGPHNINVNAVAPGLVETPLTRGLAEEVHMQALRETALGRLGRPQEIAGVIFFLCSEPARHVTGQVIVVDGGQTA